jgi:Cof subfamily protein (haloacid dehalogenase superfamily)
VIHSVYVSDLDGTLLNDRAALSDFSRDTLARLVEQGLLFTVASARSVVSIRMMLPGLRLPLPVVEFNGAFLSDLETGRHEVVHSIAPAVVEAVYRLLPEFGCVPFVSTFNGEEDCVYYGDVINDGMRWYLNDRLEHRDPRWRRTDDLTRAFRDQVICLTLIGPAALLTGLTAAVQDRHAEQVELHYYENRYSPGWYWLTIHDRRATKDQAVRLLLERYGLVGRELVVFGDEINDLKLFRIADRAIAVANAVPALRRHATHHIGSNEEDSVARFLHAEWGSRSRQG